MPQAGIYRVNTSTDPLWIRQFCPQPLVAEAGTANKVCPVDRDPHTAFDNTWSTAKVQQVPPGQEVKVVDDREILYPLDASTSILFVPVAVASANYSGQMVRGWMAKNFLVFVRAAEADAPLPQVDATKPGTSGSGGDLEDTAEQAAALTEAPPAKKNKWVVPAVIGGLALLGVLWYLSSKKSEKRALRLPAQEFDFSPDFQPAMAGLRRRRTTKRRRRARR